MQGLTRKSLVVKALVITAAVVLAMSACGSQPDPVDDRYSRETLAAADYFDGKRAFTQRCGACHTLADDGSNLVGPNLYGLFERPASGC